MMIDVYNMHGWIQKHWKLKISSPAQREQEAMVSSDTSPSSTSSSSPSSSSSSSSSSTPSKPPQPHSALSSEQRWSRKYDLFVCHSSVHGDIKEAIRLVSYLESSPRSLRCFLMQRDACPGGAISTELCQAVRDSHVRALLITPDFLQDDWCMYMMHQILAEAPMSKRIIPLIQNLSHSQYPQELRFYYYTDLDKNPDSGYTKVNTTVLKYLKDLLKNEETPDGQHGHL